MSFETEKNFREELSDNQTSQTHIDELSKANMIL